MPKVINKNAIFQEAYGALGVVRADRHSILHTNTSATESFLPGEPFAKAQGAGSVVVLSQSLIEPGQTKSVILDFKAIFPCSFSADIEDGDEVYWDLDNEVVSLAADVTNGFSLGYASYELDPAQSVAVGAAGDPLTADTDGKVVVANDASTHVIVVSLNAPTTLKGTAAALAKPATTLKE